MWTARRASRAGGARSRRKCVGGGRNTWRFACRVLIRGGLDLTSGFSRGCEQRTGDAGDGELRDERRFDSHLMASLRQPAGHMTSALPLPVV
jgi:hypothetical protein